jgi:hypothetical protein
MVNIRFASEVRIFRSTLAISFFVLALSGPALRGQSAPEGDTRGEPWTGPAGVQERTDAIMARGLVLAATRRPYRIHARAEFDFSDEEQHGPRFEPAPRFPGTDSPVPGPLVATNGQTLDVNFTGATLADEHAYPPDSMGTVGPSQFIVAVNGRIRSFNKSTGVADGVLNADTDAFFNSVMTPPASNNFTSDPRIRYDRLSGKWFIIIIDVPGQTGALPDRVMIAVSDSGVITGSSVWTFFYFQHDLVGATPNNDTGNFADYPTLGIDANALYIGVNVFGGRGPSASFNNTTGFVIRKSSLLGAGPIVVTAFRQLIPHGNSGGPYTPHGVDNYDQAATEGYFIGVNSRYYGKLTLNRVSNPGGTPSLSANVNIDLPSVNGPTIKVPHLGNTGGSAGELDGLDYRLMAAHFRNGQLWTTENMGVDSNGTRNTTATRDGVRWYVLSGIPTGQTPTVSQWGLAYDPTAQQRSYWMGTVMVSGQGHAAMGFSVAGPNDHANAGTVGRLANDPAGTMRTPVLYTASSSAYNPRDGSGNPIDRWGDYSYTSLDPSDDMTMWTIQEFCNAANSYGVQVVRLLAPLPATPTNCSPASIAAGAANVNVVVTGMTDGAAGFFDPGAGFPNRIAAAVSGSGVTINSVTYSNPTHVTINVSVSGSAPSGSRLVTITNPDGQSAVSPTAILAITGGGANSPPVLTATSSKTIDELSTLTVTNTASDPNGDSLSYSLDPGGPSGASINPTTGVFTWMPNESQGPGLYTNTVRVTDNGSPPLSDVKSFTVTVNEVNIPPVLTAISNKTINEGSLLTFTNSATDPDLPANTLTYSLDPGFPTGASVNPATGVFTWTPDESQGPGLYTNTVRVTDNGSPPMSDAKSFTVTVNEVNSPPVLAAISNKTINEGALLTFTNSATDPDLPANTLTYSLDPGFPAGASVNPTTGVFTWTPDESQGPGLYTNTVRVTDNGSPPMSNSKSFTVTVNEVNSPPVLAGVANRTIHQGATLVITNTATDSDLPANTFTFGLAASPPAGATIGSASGVFTWTPSPAFLNTTNPISLKVTDNGSPPLSDTNSFSVTVVAPPQIQSILVTNDAATVTWSAISGQSYRLQVRDSLTLPGWSNLAPDVLASGPAATKTDSPLSATNRFYRVMVVP